MAYHGAADIAVVLQWADIDAVVVVVLQLPNAVVDDAVVVNRFVEILDEVTLRALLPCVAVVALVVV